MNETQTQAQPVVIEQSKSLLDQIVERQAEVASRYMPVMTAKQAIQRRDAIAELKNLVLVEGVDYGVIPGTDKPTLYKPGAEKICAFFGYVPSYEVVGEIEDWAGSQFGEPLFYYRYRCTLMKDSSAVGQGEGSANTWEAKYRYRNAARKCPACGQEAIIKGKDEYGGGWLCYGKKGGCGAKFVDGDKKIEGQTVGRIANPDFADVINTVQKMGQKRAYIAATLSATGASQWFTQDMEDMPREETIADIKRAAAKVETGGAPVGTKQAAQNVAERKIAEAQVAAKPKPTEATKQAAASVNDMPGKGGTSATVEQPKAASGLTNSTRLPVDFKVIMAKFAEIKGIIGESAYYTVLKNVGGEQCAHSNQLGSMPNFQAAYDAMVAIAKGMEVPA